MKDALDDVSPVRFLTLRFLVGGALLFVLAWVEAMRRRRKAPHLQPVGDIWSARTWRDGSQVGIALFLGFLTQTIGLVWTTPATSAFLTGLSVGLVPVIAVLFFRQRVGGWTWAGVGAAFLGMTALTLKDRLTPGVGELVTIGTAIAFALQILFLDRYAARSTPLSLTAVQLVIGAGLGLLCLPLDGWLAARAPEAVPVDAQFAALPARALFAVVAMGVVASAGCFFLQTYAQRHVPAARVGVLLALEPVFAGVFSYALYGERFGTRGLAGMALILAGMIVVETLGRREQLARTPAA